MPGLVLVFEDDPPFPETLEAGLRRRGFRAAWTVVNVALGAILVATIVYGGFTQGGALLTLLRSRLHPPSS